MTQNNLSRFFGGFGNGLWGLLDAIEIEAWILPILVIFLLFLAFGEEIMDFFLCNDTATHK